MKSSAPFVACHGPDCCNPINFHKTQKFQNGSVYKHAVLSTDREETWMSHSVTRAMPLQGKDSACIALALASRCVSLWQSPTFDACFLFVFAFCGCVLRVQRKRLDWNFHVTWIEALSALATALLMCFICFQFSLTVQTRAWDACRGRVCILHESPDNGVSFSMLKNMIGNISEYCDKAMYTSYVHSVDNLLRIDSFNVLSYTSKFTNAAGTRAIRGGFFDSYAVCSDVKIGAYAESLMMFQMPFILIDWIVCPFSSFIGLIILSIPSCLFLYNCIGWDSISKFICSIYLEKIRQMVKSCASMYSARKSMKYTTITCSWYSVCVVCVVILPILMVGPSLTPTWVVLLVSSSRAAR